MVLQERVKSRRVVTEYELVKSVEMHFWLTGTANDEAAWTYTLANTLGQYAGLNRKSVNIEPEWVNLTTNDGLWYITIVYGEYPIVGESTFSFDTSGGQQHITQSLQTVARRALPGRTPSDCKGAIGVTNDSVEGVDIVMPVYSFSEAHYFVDEFVTLDYRLTLRNLTATVNNSAWRGFEAGEVLFLGAAGSKRGFGDWEIRFSFASSENEDEYRVGDVLPAPKKGWHWAWVRYADDTDVSSASWVKTPKELHIEKVYKESDFTLLGIGV